MIVILRMLAPLATLLAAFVLTLLAPGTACAEDDATIEMARQRFREGVNYYDQRDYEKARLAFLQAYALKPHPSVLLNLAQSELRAGKPADAAMHFSQYLRDSEEVSEAEKQEAELGFAAARTKVGEVKLEVDEEGATISVDGEEKGKTPLKGPLYVMPGAHRIEAVLDDSSGATTVDVDAGQSVSAAIRLREQAPGAAAPGVTSSGLGEDEPEGDGDVEADFAVDSRGRQGFGDWFLSQPVAWVGAGLTVLGLGGGTILAVSAKRNYDSADAVAADLVDQQGRDVAADRFADPEEGACNRSTATNMRLGLDLARRYDAACALYEERVDTADREKTLATVGFIVGGVAAVGTIAFYFLDSSESTEAKGKNGFRARLVPNVGPGESGLILVGQF